MQIYKSQVFYATYKLNRLTMFIHGVMIKERNYLLVFSSILHMNKVYKRILSVFINNIKFTLKMRGKDQSNACLNECVGVKEHSD